MGSDLHARVGLPSIRYVLGPGLLFRARKLNYDHASKSCVSSLPVPTGHWTAKAPRRQANRGVRALSSLAPGPRTRRML